MLTYNKRLIACTCLTYVIYILLCTLTLINVSQPLCVDVAIMLTGSNDTLITLPVEDVFAWSGGFIAILADTCADNVCFETLHLMAVCTPAFV